MSKTVASLPKGGTSDVIDAGYAYVILHVDDKQEAHVKTLDEVKSEIEPQIKQQKASRAAQNLADQLLSDARSPKGLDSADAAKGLQVVSTELNLSGPFWRFVNDSLNLGAIGYFIIGIFVVSWAGSGARSRWLYSA